MTDCNLIRIEPDDRLVVLARTLQVQAPHTEAILAQRVLGDTGLGRMVLGYALYRHCSVFQGSSDAPVWSHIDLTYYRDIVPERAVHEFVLTQQPEGVQLLRAEVLLTTPSSFVMPLGWQGSRGRLDQQASLEYIDVRPADLAAYRDVMRRHVGPTAGKLVASGRFGTFRAMETDAVLFQDPALGTGWNQIHLCEVDAASFRGFGQELDAVPDGDAPEGGFAGVFANLAPMRTIPRWTFNDAVVEADLALAQSLTREAC
ncbi:hypothetical protein [Methylobacterium variabile]|jgi:hypothetical protein|nr:hypothetical protein [Methylobacterium variabile]